GSLSARRRANGRGANSGDILRGRVCVPGGLNCPLRDGFLVRTPRTYRRASYVRNRFFTLEPESIALTRPIAYCKVLSSSREIHLKDYDDQKSPGLFNLRCCIGFHPLLPQWLRSEQDANF